MASGKASREAEPQRGDVVGLQPPPVSLPPEGAMPVAVSEIALETVEYLLHGDALMLWGDEGFDWEGYDAIKPFSAPELRSQRVR